MAMIRNLLYCLHGYKLCSDLKLTLNDLLYKNCLVQQFNFKMYFNIFGNGM